MELSSGGFARYDKCCTKTAWWKFDLERLLGFFCFVLFQFPEENGIIVLRLLEGNKPINRSAIITCTFH